MFKRVGRLLGRTEQRSISSLPWQPFDQGGPLNPSAVNVDRALQLGPVYAAGRLLASSVASLPLQAYRRTGDQRQRLGALPSLLQAPSVQGTLYDWLFRCVTSLAYRGNAVGLITARDRDEHPTMVEWLDPDDVRVIDQMPSGPGSFTQPQWFWRGRPVGAEELVHIPWFVLPGRVWGLSPVGAYAATVCTGLAAQRFSADWFANGGVPPGTFKNEEKVVNQDELKVIKARLVQAIRTREPIVYGRDWTYTPVTVAPHEAQFVQTMRLGATQIAAIYGIPPEMVGGETGSSMTYANVEQQAINFVQFTLLPWLTKLEAAFFALLPRPQYVKFNADALIRVDAKTRYETYQVARNIGLLSVDEIRALEDLAPLPDGQGATFVPQPLLEKGIGSVPKAGAMPPAPAPTGELGRPRLVEGGQGG